MTVSLQRLYKLLIVLGLVLSIDLLTKYLTQKYIPLMHWASFEYPYGGIPVFKDFALEMGPMFVLLSYFVIVGSSNAVNLTDGLDGLAIMPVI